MFYSSNLLSLSSEQKPCKDDGSAASPNDNLLASGLTPLGEDVGSDGRNVDDESEKGKDSEDV